MGGSNNKPEQNQNNNNINETPKEREIDLTPDEIQEMMKSKADLEDKVTELTSENKVLKEQINIYENNNAVIQGNLQNMNRYATLNMNQAFQQIMLLKSQNEMLNNQIYQLKQNVNNLNIENNKLQFYCYKMQIMLLNNMQENSMKNNINSMQSLNSSPMNNNNNNMNNNHTGNFNYQKAANSLTIIFNVNNKMKCPVATFPNHKLGNIFVLALYQNGYTNFVNIRNFTFRYNTENISNLFYDNKEVKDFTFSQGFPVIEVFGDF